MIIKHLKLRVKIIFGGGVLVVYNNELDWVDAEVISCPVCGYPLSFLRAVHQDTGEIVIVVTCEFCEEYHGFAVKTGVTLWDLDRYVKTRKRVLSRGVEVHGYEPYKMKEG